MTPNKEDLRRQHKECFAWLLTQTLPTQWSDLEDMVWQVWKLATEQERERQQVALREWAVERWKAEVQHRPLINHNRRPLDDTWRQVMRYAGMDHIQAVGPTHDQLLATANQSHER